MADVVELPNRCPDCGADELFWAVDYEGSMTYRVRDVENREEGALITLPCDARSDEVQQETKWSLYCCAYGCKWEQEVDPSDVEIAFE